MLHNLASRILLPPEHRELGKQTITIVSSSLLWNSDLQIWKEDDGRYLSKNLVSGFEVEH